MGHEHGGIIMKMSLRHAKRLENIRLGEIAKRPAADALDDRAEQIVRAIVVLELGAGWKIYAALSRKSRRDGVIHADSVFTRRSDPNQCERITQSARMVEQV